VTRDRGIDRRARALAIAMLLVSTACSTAAAPSPIGTSAGTFPPTTSPTASPSASPTASPSPSASPTPSVGEDWERVPDQPSLRNVQLYQVAWTGARFVGTGSDGQFLDSTDGRTWNLQGQSWPTGQVWGIAASARGAIAVGELDGRAASWHSSDGLKWTIAPDDASLDAASDAQIRMRGVTETDDGWLAVGEEDESCQINCPAAARAVVWRSADGIHWTQERASRSLASALMTGVTRGGPGYVAVGQSLPNPTSGVVWTSADGLAWSRLADGPVFHAPPGTDQTFGASMSAVTLGNAGTLVAVGTVGTQGDKGSALAWWSTDGRTWTAVKGDGFLNGQLFDVAATSRGFVATGPSGADSCLGGIWTSTDGRSWICSADDPAFADFAAYSGAGSPDVEVVVGFGPPFSMPGGAPAASVWVRSAR
jgi:hypothetical protein